MNADVLMFFMSTYPVTELHYALCDYDFVCMFPDAPIRCRFTTTQVSGCSTMKTNSRRTHLHLFCEPVLAIA